MFRFKCTFFRLGTYFNLPVLVSRSTYELFALFRVNFFFPIGFLNVRRAAKRCPLVGHASGFRNVNARGLQSVSRGIARRQNVIPYIYEKALTYYEISTRVRFPN